MTGGRRTASGRGPAGRGGAAARRGSARATRAARRHVLGLLEIKPFRRRWPVALKASVAVMIPLAVATALGHQEWAMTCSLGAFTVLFGARTAGRFRARLYAVLGAGFVLAAALGAFTAHLPAVHLTAMVLFSACAVFLASALKVGPPGAVFFPLNVGVAGFIVTHGGSPWQVVLTVAVGATTAWIVGMSDLLIRPRGPEEDAVATAAAAVARYEEVDDADAEAFDTARAAASNAMHAAWTTVTDGAGRRSQKGRLDLVQRLRDLHHRYAMRTAFASRLAINLGTDLTAGRDGAAVRKSAPEEPASADQPGHPSPPSSTRIDLERLRQNSLGRPSARYLLVEEATWPSETLVTTVRATVAAAVAALVAVLLGPGHTYWAVFTAVLVLHQGGTKLAQTYRGLQRLLGTAVGVFVFAGIVWLDPRGWWLVLVLGALQFGVEMLVVRNYAAGSVLITPLALLIGWVGAGRVGAEGVLVDRLADTVIAVVVALVVLWTVGRGTPLLVFRGQGRRCILAMEAAMSDVAARLPDTPLALERRRHLYYELLEYETVGDRALADDPRAVRPYLAMRREIVELGYVVLGSAWHPSLRLDAGRFARARQGFAPILAAPVTQPRAAADIEADIRAVHHLVREWDGAEDPEDGRDPETTP